jgi:hypothetical protein
MQTLKYKDIKQKHEEILDYQLNTYLHSLIAKQVNNNIRCLISSYVSTIIFNIVYRNVVLLCRIKYENFNI